MDRQKPSCQANFSFDILLVMAHHESAPPGTIRQVDAPPGVLAQPSPLLGLHTSEPPLAAFTQLEHNPKTQPSRASELIVGWDDNAVFLAGMTNRPLAESIGGILQQAPHTNSSQFKDGEIKVLLPQVEATDVQIFQSMAPAPNDSLVELQFMLMKAKESGASDITVTTPYMAYNRQDREDQAGVAVTATYLANMLHMLGAHRVIAVDVHAEGPLRKSTIEWANLDSSTVLIPAIQDLIERQELTNIVVGFPDKGAQGRYQNYVDALTPGAEPAVISKKRRVDVPNQTEIVGMSGDVEGKVVIMIDDVLDTCGSANNAAEYMKDQGARSVWVVATHGVFSGRAFEIIEEGAIDGVIVTDTTQSQKEEPKKIQRVSTAPVLAEAVWRIQNRLSIDHLLKKKQPGEPPSCSEGFESSYMTRPESSQPSTLTN